MKWIQWVLLKIQSGHDSVHRWTDGRTDGQGETSIHPFQLRWSGGYNNGIGAGDGLDHDMEQAIIHLVIHVIRPKLLLTHWGLATPYGDTDLHQQWKIKPKCSPITCCLAPRARASQMTIPPLTGGPQPRKSGWSIVEISNSGHTRNFAHNENTFCSMPYHNLVEMKPCVLM